MPQHAAFAGGVPIWQAAGFMGLTAAEFERTYAHHHPDHLRAATDAISAALDGV